MAAVKRCSCRRADRPFGARQRADPWPLCRCGGRTDRRLLSPLRHGPAGSVGLVVLVPLAAAYTAWARGRLGWAGIFTGLALAKPQLLLFVPRAFRSPPGVARIGRFAAVIAALGAVSLVGFGIGPVLGYRTPSADGQSAERLPTNGQIVYTDTAVYSLRNVLEAVPGGGKGLALAILILLLALVALSLSWRPDKPRLDFALAIAASLVLSPHQNVHDLALLVIPGFALADLALAGDLRWREQRPSSSFSLRRDQPDTCPRPLVGAIGALAIGGVSQPWRGWRCDRPYPLGELRWSGTAARVESSFYRLIAPRKAWRVVGDIPAGHADRILLVDDASAGCDSERGDGLAP